MQSEYEASKTKSLQLMGEVDLEVFIHNWKVNINYSMNLHREYFAKKYRKSNETVKPCPTVGNPIKV
jgi:hypothetical protein